MHSKNEDVFFRGGLILVLALIGLASSIYTRRFRIGLACGVVVCCVLAFGMGLTGAGYPYRLLYDYAPGWDGVRVPGRVFTLATLFLALLAGAGAWQLTEIARRWARGWGPKTGGVIVAAVGALLFVGVVGEGAGHLGHPVVPQPAKAEIGLPGPVMDLPTDGADDRVWQYFSTDGFYKIPVGNSTFDMPEVDDLRGGMGGFPDKASIEKLRWYGIKTVVLHLKRAELPGLQCSRGARATRSGRGRRQAGHRAGRHPPARGRRRHLRDRPWAEGTARKRLIARHAVSQPASSSPPPTGDSRSPILLVGLSYATMIQSFSWNQTSHYDLIRSLDQDKTTIDQYQTNTGDKAEYKGHWYSARAPGLALYSLPFYDALKWVGAESWTDRHVAPPNHPATR